MKEARLLAATGMLGSGFSADSLQRGLAMAPHLIGVDAGSSDGGPYYLGSGQPYFADQAVLRDLRLLLPAAIHHGIPLVIGSAGMSGCDVAVDRVVDHVLRIAQEEGLRFRLATIRCEQEPGYLVDKLRDGRIKPLSAAGSDLREHTIRDAVRIVGMAGPEPFMEAIDSGAQVIVAGRSSDTSIFASLPLMMGLEPGPVWHASKILECGAGAVAKRLHPDCLFAIVRDEGFVVEPPNPRFSCTPLSVASHNLYETASPYDLVEPSGSLDLRACRYQALDERRVLVTGSGFRPADRYTIKLEGVKISGYSCFFVGGIRDPFILRQLDDWLARLEKALHHRFSDLHGAAVERRYRLLLRRYGIDGVMDRLEPSPLCGHEVGLMLEVVADTPELAWGLTKTAAHLALHFPIPEWSGLISTLAFPHSPPEVQRGPVFEFVLDHVVEPGSPTEMFPLELTEVGTRPALHGRRA